MEELLNATRAATANIEQRDPLAHRRRRRQRGSGGGGLPNGGPLHSELKKSLGNMSDEDKKKADQLWKMLDDMYENDPAEYRTFIENQMRLGKEEAAKNNGTDGSGKSSTLGTIGRGDEGSLRGTFTPKPGFVVKAKERFSKEKIFLNICHSEAIKRPLAANGTELKDDAPPSMARQIPLVVGKPREAKDMSGRDCRVLDVVFNEWVIKNCLHNNMFKVQVVELAFQWCKEDHNLQLQRDWKCPKSVYKGGSGPRGNVPVPFPVDIPADQREAAKTSSSSPSRGGERGDRNKEPSIVEATAAPVMDNPADLLRSMRSQDRFEEQSPSFHGGVEKAAARKPLVQEIDTDDPEPATGANSKSKRKQKKGKKKSAVKKGFLAGSKHKALYPTGSNEGDPKGIFSKMNVVDTRTMSQEQIAEAVQQHAAPRKAQPKATAKPKAKARQPEPSKQRKKGEHPIDQAEFDNLMKLLDPEALDDNNLNIAEAEDLFKKIALGGDSANNQYAKQFASLSQLLSSESGESLFQTPSATESVASGAKTTLNSSTVKKKREEEDSGRVDDTVTKAASSSSSDVAAPIYDLKKTSLNNGREGIKVILHLPKHSSMAGVDLQVSTKALKFSSPMYASVKIDFDARVDDKSVQAKFSKKKRQLKVTVTKQ